MYATNKCIVNTNVNPIRANTPISCLSIFGFSLSEYNTTRPPNMAVTIAIKSISKILIIFSNFIDIGRLVYWFKYFVGLSKVFIEFHKSQKNTNNLNNIILH